MTEKLDRFVSKPELARTLSMTTRSVDNWCKAGRLPPPDRLPNGRPAWRESVLREVLHLD